MSVGSVSKFIFAISAAFASAESSGFGFLIIIVLAVMTAYLSWGASLKDLFKVARYVVWFFILVFALHLFSLSGRQIFEIWGLKATVEGANAGVFYGIKLIAFAYAAFIIFQSVDPFELIIPIEKAAKRMGSPGRYLSSFAIAFSLALRFLPDLSNQAGNTMIALKSRGIDFSGNLTQKIKAANLIFISIMVHAFKKSESVAVALNVKGYSTRYKKAVFEAVKFSFSSAFVIAVSISMVLGGWLSR